MSDYVNVTELFGCDVFNDSVMEERLPKKVYKELKKTIEEGKELSPEVASSLMVLKPALMFPRFSFFISRPSR